MKELFILIHPKHTSAMFGANWTASEPHDGTFDSMVKAHETLVRICQEQNTGEGPFITRVFFEK